MAKRKRKRQKKQKIEISIELYAVLLMNWLSIISKLLLVKYIAPPYWA